LKVRLNNKRGRFENEDRKMGKRGKCETECDSSRKKKSNQNEEKQ